MGLRVLAARPRGSLQPQWLIRGVWVSQERAPGPKEGWIFRAQQLGPSANAAPRCGRSVGARWPPDRILGKVVHQLRQPVLPDPRGWPGNRVTISEAGARELLVNRLSGAQQRFHTQTPSHHPTLQLSRYQLRVLGSSSALELGRPHS